MAKKIRYADTRPARVSPVDMHVPKTVSQRRRMLDRFGNVAFLLPEGTKARPGVPSYPIVSARTGRFHCGMMRIAYTRIGAAINRTRSPTWKAQLRAARQRLIRTAHRYADSADASNTCNFAIKARRRYPS